MFLNDVVIVKCISTIEEAEILYKTMKKEYIIKVSEFYKNAIPINVYNAIVNYEL